MERNQSARQPKQLDSQAHALAMNNETFHNDAHAIMMFGLNRFAVFGSATFQE